MAAEAKFQRELKRWLEEQGCIVLKQQASIYTPKGVPDLLVFYKRLYFVIECKASAQAKYRPGQEEWLKRFERWTYAITAYPENLDKIKRDVITWLKQEDCDEDKFERKRSENYTLGTRPRHERG